MKLLVGAKADVHKLLGNGCAAINPAAERGANRVYKTVSWCESRCRQSSTWYDNWWKIGVACVNSFEREFGEALFFRWSE